MCPHIKRSNAITLIQSAADNDVSAQKSYFIMYGCNITVFSAHAVKMLDDVNYFTAANAIDATSDTVSFLSMLNNNNDRVRELMILLFTSC